MNLKDKFISLWKKTVNRETITYVLVGGATTVIDYAVFAALNILFKHGGMTAGTSSVIATALSWCMAVTFAFFANKLAVFRSRDMQLKVILREATQFFAARGISGGITVALVALFVGGMGMNEYIAKVLTMIFSMGFNYVASKFVIFKKK